MSVIIHCFLWHLNCYEREHLLLSVHPLQRAENQGQHERGILDTEIIQLKTELEQLRARSDAERATYMTALEEKDKEIAAEVEDKV